jgi:hypothetical protein
MSWSFDIKGAADKEAAKAQVQEHFESSHGHFPENARALVDAAIDALPDCEDSVINVASFGHFQLDSTYRGTSNLSVVASNAFAPKPAE